MFRTTSETEGEVVNVKLVSAPNNSLFSVACFGVRVSVTFHLTCVHIIFCSVLVAN